MQVCGCACGERDREAVDELRWLLFFYLTDDWNFVVVANGIFAQEIKFHDTIFAIQLFVECDVLNT